MYRRKGKEKWGREKNREIRSEEKARERNQGDILSICWDGFLLYKAVT